MLDTKPHIQIHFSLSMKIVKRFSLIHGASIDWSQAHVDVLETLGDDVCSDEVERDHQEIISPQDRIASP